MYTFSNKIKYNIELIKIIFWVDTRKSNCIFSFKHYETFYFLVPIEVA